MKSTLKTSCLRSVVLILAVLNVSRVAVMAQPMLRVYGSEGPAFAITEAAAAFEKKTACRVEVVSGPPGTWLAQAEKDADVVYASAGYMMSDFVRNKELQVVEESVKPLYLRASAVLVRPDNPKNIQDFPDLLRPKTRIMVVSGSGQTGLWEDMAGKQGDIQTVRAFRENVVLFAADSTEAMRQWKQRSDIDAWVTWDIWQKPLHDEAKTVRVSEDYVVYRQCSVALTHRGGSHPYGARFIDFLASPEGEAIFKSWEWLGRSSRSLPEPAPSIPAGR